VAARSEAWVCGNSLAEVAGSHHAWVVNVSVACCEVEASASGRSLVQGSLAEGGVSEYDLETSKRRRP